MDLIPAFDPYPGAQIAGYKLEALVGRGGMSLVYRARHEHLDRTVALKLLTPQLSRDERFRQRFVRESRLAASLDHPNIIPIYDAGEAGGFLYIAMRLVEGPTLAQLLDGGPLPTGTAVWLIDQIAGALDVAHRAGLVHRDVKPENVLITEKDDALDRVFLSDFGLTKHPNTAATTKSGELMGTVAYIAPEQIKGEPPDDRTDIYSLGCVLYQCLTGRRPFDLDNDVATLWAHLNNPPPSVTDRRPDLPRQIDGVIATAMAKDGSQRFQSAGALAAAARDALAEEASPEQPSSPSAPAPESRRRWLLLASIAVVVVAVIAALIVKGLRAPSPKPATASGPKPLGQPLSTKAINRSPDASVYRNPIVVHPAPDPDVIASGGIFYAYTTQSIYQRPIHIPVLASKNLVRWGFLRDALPRLPDWALTKPSDTWAPHVVRVHGHYNMYLAIRLRSTHTMGIAVATSRTPRGPFHVVGRPLMHAAGYRDIDPFLLQRPGGGLLLYWGSGGAPIKVRRLTRDGTSLKGPTVPVLGTSSATRYDRVVEGVAVVHHGGFYYLFYSGDRCCGLRAHYAVLVARSKSPFGPFQRAPQNPIIAANNYFMAPGHGSIIRDDNGDYFILYHAMVRADPTRLRYLMLDRIRWSQGWPVVNGGRGPSHTLEPRPQLGASQ